MRHGGRLSPILLNIFINLVFEQALTRTPINKGLLLRHTKNGTIQNKQPNGNVDWINSSLFAVDVTLLTNNKDSMQELTNIFMEDLEKQGLKVNDNKT